MQPTQTSEQPSRSVDTPTVTTPPVENKSKNSVLKDFLNATIITIGLLISMIGVVGYVFNDTGSSSQTTQATIFIIIGILVIVSHAYFIARRTRRK